MTKGSETPHATLRQRAAAFALDYLLIGAYLVVLVSVEREQADLFEQLV